jgi:hypothetical protein
MDRFWVFKVDRPRFEIFHSSSIAHNPEGIDCPQSPTVPVRDRISEGFGCRPAPDRVSIRRLTRSRDTSQDSIDL